MLPPPRPGSLQTDADASIRMTDSDAAIARLSAVKLNYLDDPYVKYLVPRAHLQPPRPPLINIGTYTRSTAIDELVYQWLRLSELEGRPCQIVSLGAGSDTRFWRLAVRYLILVSIRRNTHELSARQDRLRNSWHVM
jgi:[phosphatase 2A protein]-leucine-carboxy methyltransferase